MLGNFNPSNNINDDKLERTNFANKVGQLILSRPELSIVYGIDGIWGIGKTTFVNFIIEEMEKQHFKLKKLFLKVGIIVSLILLFRMFLIKSKMYYLKTVLAYLKIKFLLRRISSAITETSLGVFKINPSLFFDIDEKEALTSIINKEFKSQLLIFIDDLERLTNEELHAIFRMIRLLSGIPRIKFILIYDKKFLLKNLFPENGDQSISLIARDYISKIVQVEFNISIPPEKIRKKLLEDALKTLPKLIQTKFLGFVNNNSITHHIFELLPSPREIHRVLSFTIWIYSINNESKYNLIDFFILVLFFQRVPELYYNLQTYSEYIINILRQDYNWN